MLCLMMKVVMFLDFVFGLVLVQMISVLVLGVLVIQYLLLFSIQWLLCFFVCSFIEMILLFVFFLDMVSVLIVVLVYSVGRYFVCCLLLLFSLIWFMYRLECVLQDRLMLVLVWVIFLVVMIWVRQDMFVLFYFFGMVMFSKFNLLNFGYSVLGNVLLWLICVVIGVRWFCDQ